jgi:sterol desaturase/sphingolipid hydroxylase (fatty acid hydroxylase superfamily)
VWFLCLLAADFLAYWYHRFSHRVAMFWASHEVHHQSEGLDLTVSLRVPALDYYYWLFDLPLAALGFPPAFRPTPPWSRGWALWNGSSSHPRITASTMPGTMLIWTGTTGKC